MANSGLELRNHSDSGRARRWRLLVPGTFTNFERFQTTLPMYSSFFSISRIAVGHPFMKRDNLLGDLKLLPEHRRALELLNKAADGLRESCGQKTDASQQGSAHNAKPACHSEDSQHSAKGEFYDGTK
jgi:hypothetical protein